MRYVFDASFLTHYAPIDAQHGKLFDMVNELGDSISGKTSGEDLKKELDFLSDYTIKHFFDEEKLTKKYNYSKFAAHQKNHEAFKAEVKRLCHQLILEGMSQELLVEVQKKVGNWLVDHIKGEDLDWARELKRTHPDLFAEKSSSSAPVSGTFTASARDVTAGGKPGSSKSAVTGPSRDDSRAVTVKEDKGPIVPPPVTPPGPPRPPAPSRPSGPKEAAPAEEVKQGGILLVKVTATASFFVLAAVLVSLFLAAKAFAFPLLLLAAAALVLASAAGQFFIFKFLFGSPVAKMSSLLAKAEKGDLSRELKITGHDDMGKLASLFNGVLKNFKDLVITIQDQGENLEDMGAELTAHSKESVGAINEIQKAIQNIKERTIRQSASVKETNFTMGKITGNINRLNGEVEEQSESVSQSSAAVEEMLANIESVTKICQNNTVNVERLAEASEVGKLGLEEVVQDIQGIAKQSEGLLEINEVMENIASQTNLLSMNAAIEAAHAGEAGKGFAVVADEIRKLAENSSEQSKTISDVLKKIKNEITKMQNATDAVLGKFEAMDSGVKTVAAQEEQIRGAMEEQSAGSRQILLAIGTLNEITRKVKSGAAEMLSDSVEIIEEGKNLEQATADINARIEEIAGRIDGVNSSVGRLDELNGKNKKNLSALSESVSRFSVARQYFVWDSSIATEIPLIDQRHKRLFEAINRLVDACAQGIGQTELKKSLDFLMAYTVKHFDEEEKIQREYNYPDYSSHRKIHEAFKETVRSLSRDLVAKGVSEELIQRVKTEAGDWLLKHITVMDLKLSKFIKEAEAGRTLGGS
ncbi:MAG: bacteriohemerythrin [Treponema sp.]|jgi:hemerythrin-like metal-binding protein|nr:bacteriohemerythrin [Treponema sp.]